MAIQSNDNMFAQIFLGVSGVFSTPPGTTVFVDGVGVTGGGEIMNVSLGVLAARGQGKVNVTSPQPLDAATVKFLT